MPKTNKTEKNFKDKNMKKTNREEKKKDKD